MKKITKKMVFSIVFSMLILTGVYNINAASVNVSSNKNSVSVGESFTITVAGTGAAVYNAEVNVSGAGINDTIYLNSYSDNLQNENKSTSKTYTANNIGTITVSVNKADVTVSGASGSTNINGNSISITVKEKTQSNTSSNTSTNNTSTSTSNKTTTTNNNTSSTAKNNNAYLSKLQVNQEGLTPNFNKNKTSYAITVGENVDSLKVTATPEASTSKVSVTGNTNLKNGDNKVYVTVTAQDGTKKVYTITVTKTGDVVKSNSYLESLIVENATLSPEFSKEVFEYDCGTVGASVENLKILAFGENENVKIEITGNDELVEGENTITVKVTSEDGTTTKEYVIKVNKDSSLVEENEIQEINSLQDTNDDNKIISFFKNLWNRIKENWLIVIMYIFIIIEFVEIVYLYKHQNKGNNNNDTSNKKEKALVKDETTTLDKEFKQNKKLRRNSDDNENINEINKKRNGRQKFDNND